MLYRFCPQKVIDNYGGLAVGTKCRVFPIPTELIWGERDVRAIPLLGSQLSLPLKKADFQLTQDVWRGSRAGCDICKRACPTQPKRLYARSMRIKRFHEELKNFMKTSGRTREDIILGLDYLETPKPTPRAKKTP